MEMINYSHTEGFICETPFPYGHPAIKNKIYEYEKNNYKHNFHFSIIANGKLSRR